MRQLDVSTQVTLDYLNGLGFRFVDVESTIGRAQPDIVVYSDEQKSRPIIVAEIKRQLPSELELLHPAVQQAFRYSVLLGNKAGHLLVSDGQNHHWFKLKDGGASLEYSGPPKSEGLPLPKSENDASADQILRSSVQRIVAHVRDAGIRIDLRSGRDILRIVVARLVMPDNEQFHGLSQENGALTSVSDALSPLFSESPPTRNDWVLPNHIVREALMSLDRIPRDRLLRTDTARIFWTDIAPLLIDPDQTWCSPRALASFLVALVNPKSGEQIIDPACGTAQFLVEAHLFRRRERRPMFVGDPESLDFEPDLAGNERDPIVAEIARLNLILVGLGARLIRQIDSLNPHATGQREDRFDIVVSDPPVGKFDQNRRGELGPIHRSFAGKVETAFVEHAVRILRPGGRAALLLPEGFFFSQDRRAFRDWLLRNVKVDAIVGLPPGAWTTARSHTQASVLVFTKQQQQVDRPDYTFFVADLRSIDELEISSSATLQSRLEQTQEAFLKFADERAHGLRATPKGSVGSVVSSHFLSAERFDVAGIMLEAWRHAPQGAPSRYPVARLADVSEIILGRHVKKVGERAPELSSANYIQAGNVRRFEIDLENIPRITAQEMDGAAAALLRAGDVLVTSTGQYLGRAALITDDHLPAVASNAVTILRIRKDTEVDPRYLVAFLNSPAGVEQVEQRRIKGVAQPYLRRGDVEEIAIPLPPLVIQQSAVSEIWDLLSRADIMEIEAEKMRARAHTLLLDVLGERPIQ